MANDPRWLSPDEQRVWRLFLQATSSLDARIERQMQTSAGMPMAYYETLVRLSERPDQSMRISELSKAAFQSASRMSHALSRLEAMGWVERRKCESDGRGLIAVLTNKGLTALKNAAPGHVEKVRSDLFDALSAEQVMQLGVICEAIVSHVDSQD